jgi:dimethylhistidine N-methyltransferase
MSVIDMLGMKMPKSQPNPSALAPAIPDFGAGLEAARAELAAGLAHSPARIAPKYFYDDLGSKLFESICLLDEYELTRAEAAIFAANAPAIAQAVGQGCTLIDLGAGNCAKAAALFPVLNPQQYVPVDISAAFLRKAVAKLQSEHPDIPMLPVVLDFAETLKLPPQVSAKSRLFFYPGSSLGNFTPLQAAQFLTRIRGACGPDGAILIGIDLVKAPAIMEAAYDDALGVTAAFNLNVLRHVNRILRSDFSPRDWGHVALFNAAQHRVEMHLQARRALTVTWPGGASDFAAGARIHTENSYKYTRHSVTELLASSGFGAIVAWSDAAESFLVCHARAL